MPKLTGALSRRVPRGVGLQAADRKLGLLGLGDDPGAALVERLADLGQREAPRGAVEQARAQAVLEPRDRFADRRARHAELRGRAGEALRLDHAREHRHAGQLVHPMPPGICTAAETILSRSGR